MSLLARSASVGLVLVSVGLVGAVGCSPAPSGSESSESAVVNNDFDRNDVMSDDALVDVDAMSEADVQSFLEKTPWGARSGLADYTTADGTAASAILHDAAVANKINPLVMLVRLQMEEGLINRADAPSERVDVAMGCGCETSTSCDEGYRGFENQAYCMARTLRRDMDGLANGEATVSGWKRGVAKKSEDKMSITPANNATAALYTYTPYVGQAGGGGQGIGGTSLHWQLWKKFASTVGYKSTSSTTNPPDDCTADAGCTPPSSTTKCTKDAQCSDATPVCDKVSGKCVACRADYAEANAAPLACPTADAPACVTSGPKAGSCVECSATNSSACDGAEETPVCVTAANACGCTKDDDCDSGEYCKIDTTADVPIGACTSGCRTQGGADTCPDGQACSIKDGTVGTCVGETCDGGCMNPPNTVCDTSGTTPSCVQCLVDSDCTGGKLCDPKAKKCVQCTATNKTACTASGAGSACLANNTCGCAADRDCGGVTSGRVCDTTTHSCKTGCRQTGGNGCPDGQTCNAGQKDVGTCKTSVSGPTSDAGTTKDSGSSHSSSGDDDGTGTTTGGSSSSHNGPHNPSTGSGGGIGPEAAPPDSPKPSGGSKGGGCAMGGAPDAGLAPIGIFSALAAVLARRRRRAASSR